MWPQRLKRKGEDFNEADLRPCTSTMSSIGPRVLMHHGDDFNKAPE